MARSISVQILGDSGSLERAFRRSSSAANRFERNVGRAGRGVTSISLGYRGLARSVAFASSAFIGGAGLTAAVGASLRGFSQFNTAMQKSVGLANVSQKSIARFSQEIEQLAPRVGKSPQELANAFFFVASSGIEASKAMSVVTASAKAAAAGLGETQQVADAVTSAMNAYGPSVLSAQKATNVLVSTVREGKGEADQFAGVIGNVAALAAQLGVSFNQVGAALAAETRLGVDAQTSATQLQRVFSTFLKVTPQSAKAFAAVGLNVNALRNQLGKGPDSLIRVLLEVRKAFAGNLPALAKAFGDQRAIRGVLALVGKQAAATTGIFQRMTNVTGSLGTAFSAVSRTTAQKFNQLKASAQVLGISVGAIFAPLAGVVADALSRASASLTSFFNRIESQRTVAGKLNVVWTGIKDATTGAVSALSRAVAGIDWNRVWAGARGIADGLQKRLEAINWTSVGRTIGRGLADAVRKAIPAAQDIGARLTQAVKSIDVVKIGEALGPGLAAALVTAFTTLTDPPFWAKHWDLALSVGLVAFGDGVGKIAGKLAKPLVEVFGRLGGDAALRIAEGFSRFAPRLGQAVLAGLIRLPGLVGKALSPLTNVVERIFGRLGGLARFTVKVLGVDLVIHTISRLVGEVIDKLRRPFQIALRVSGIQAVIDRVRGMVNTVRHAISAIKHLFTGDFSALFRDLERMALNAALAIVEPFSHLPGFLGGGPFQRMKAALQSKLDAMDRSASRSAHHIGVVMTAAADSARNAANQISAASHDMQSAATQAARAQQVADRAGVPVAKATRTQKPTTTPSAPTAFPSTGAPAATKTVQTGFVLPFRLQLAEARASATRTVRDDLKVAREIRAFILQQIPKLHGQKLIDAYNQLGQVNQQIADNAKTAATAGKKALRDFTEPMKLQIAEARAQALGIPDRGILLKMKAAAEKALRSGKLSAQGQINAWNEIASVNQQIADSAKSALGQFKQLSTKKLTAGLGLTPEQRKALRARLSQIGPGGTVPQQGTGAFGFIINPNTGQPIDVHTHVNIDGKRVADNVTRHNQRRRSRNRPQRRGPNAGLAFGA